MRFNNKNNWNDTLLKYLSNSNEDECTIEIIKKQVLSHIINFNKLNWLEVGIGPGNKTIEISKIFGEKYSRLQFNLKILEPESYWIKYVKNNSVMNKLSIHSTCEIKSLSFEQFVKITPKKELRSLNFISLIHTLYSQSVYRSLLEFIKIKMRDDSTLFIVAESEKSFFFLIKKELFLKGYIVPNSFLIYQLIERLEEEKIDFSFCQSENKKCEINRFEAMNDDNYWVFPFILGLTNSQYLKLEATKRDFVLDMIRDKILKWNSTNLEIPDIYLIIHMR